MADYPDDAPTEDDFPAGDGTTDDAAVVVCPYCGEEVEITLDAGGDENQEYVEDCEVCCRPWTVTVHYRSGGAAEVRVEKLE
jgi:hypothetical protein